MEIVLVIWAAKNVDKETDCIDSQTALIQSLTINSQFMLLLLS